MARQLEIIEIDYQNHTFTIVDSETDEKIICSTQGMIEYGDGTQEPFDLEKKIKN